MSNEVEQDERRRRIAEITEDKPGLQNVGVMVAELDRDELARVHSLAVERHQTNPASVHAHKVIWENLVELGNELGLEGEESEILAESLWRIYFTHAVADELLQPGDTAN